MRQSSSSPTLSANSFKPDMGTPSAFLGTLNAESISQAELETFVTLLGAVGAAQERHDAFQHLLRKVPLNPQQVVTLAKSQPVREDVGLQLALKRYIRARQFAASHAAEQARLSSKWGVAADIVMAFFMSLPPL